MALPCNNLNLNLYRVFYVVAKTKSFSESSRLLHISQPAISKHIQNLEYELNTLLFYRTNRGIEPTSEAKNLLTYVERAYNFLMLGEKQLVESKELMKGKISIGVTSFVSNYFINSKIKEFMSTHPNIIIKITNGTDEELFNLIHQHTLDLLIIPNNINTPKDVKVLPLEKEKYCFAYNKNKLKNITEIKSIEDLVKQPLLLPTKDNNQRNKIEELFNSKGLSTDPIMELSTSEMMLNYIKEGIGIGYILNTVAKNNPDLEIINLDVELPSEIITLIYNDSTLTNSSKEFVNLLIKNIN
ncbi:MAG: LysR family transcriptional regulator [Bacilli bacterium]|nr:LysR family transcriptional regulator [Bacilli bacterium]